MEHRLIQGGEQFLPFARSCVAKLKQLGLPYVAQSYAVDGVSIKVRVEPGHEYIRIEGSNGAYEFLSSDAGYTETGDLIGIPGAASDLYPGAPFITGAGVRTAQTQAPVFSQSFADPQVPQRWPLVSIDDVLTTGNTSGARAYGSFYTFASRPNVSFQTYHWWGATPDKLVTSVCATGNGRSWVDRRGRVYSAALDAVTKVDAESEFGYSIRHTDDHNYVATGTTVTFHQGGEIRNLGFNSYLRTQTDLSFASPLLYLRSSPITTYSLAYWRIDPVEGDTYFPYDAVWDGSAAARASAATYYEAAGMYDVAPASYAGGRIRIGGTQRTPQTNWRHAAAHTAIDDFGASHRFIVSTDTHGVFTFYREDDYSALGFDARNIPADKTKVIRVVYPSWVTVIDDNVSTAEDHWQWSFNKDASKACTTPLHHEDYYMYLMIRDYIGAYGRTVSVQLPKSARATADVRYTAQRLKIFRVKPGSNYTAGEISSYWGSGSSYASSRSVFGAEYQGKIIPLNINTEIVNIIGFDTFPGMNSTEMVPEKKTMPGFVEVAISIFVDQSGDFFPSVSITDSEQYSDRAKFYMDCAYFIASPGKAAGLLTKDDLLTGEIEVFSSDNEVIAPTEAAVSYRQYGLESVAVAGLATANTHAFYTVRRRSDQLVVSRLALARGADITYGCINETDYGSSTVGRSLYLGCLEQADLRFLSFMTISYSRRSGLYPYPIVSARSNDQVGTPWLNASDSLFRVKALPPFLRPRFELRIHGVGVKTIDYSRPEITELSANNDIMTDASLPDGVIDRSLDPLFSAATLMAKQYLAANHFFITNNDTFSFRPDGSWAVYADRRSIARAAQPEAPDLITAAMPISTDSTEQSGVFDVISPAKGKSTSHLAAFNKAFGETRTYDFYSPEAKDMGGFGRCGIWSPK